ncbi:hypothetical protein [Saccharopolyspora hattusasensis]|uniref:hypothetical protein n=1 Tax=Saccharopolyspora hattusasensis TaxID=1128679 RepID=UPI003D96FF60
MSRTIRGGGWKTLLGTLLTAAVSFGVLNTGQATALDNLVAAVVTLITFATSAVAQFHVLDNAEPQLTPVADPRDNTDRHFIPAPAAESDDPLP